MTAGGDLVVENIGALLTLAGDGLGLVPHAAVAIRGGRVAFAGPAAALPAGLEAPRLDAGGALVSPGLVDPHTHLVWAGSRAHEFDLRNQGKGYLEIQQAGGGILASVRATRAASDEELVTAALARLDRFLAHGTTCIEAKSGYDLSVDGELRLLGVLAEVRRRHVVDVSPTLLAHVPPPAGLDGEGARDAFLRGLTEGAIAAASIDHLAEAVDVYCDAGAFTLDETRALLQAGRAAGLALRCHAEQFTHTGAAALAAELGARSVEHLEELDDDARARLASAGTVCNLLPGAVLTLRLKWPDARALYRAGCRVALGTDCNPGSSLSESQPLMMSLATTQMGLSVTEAWRAVTVEAAHACLRPDRGRLLPGAVGDLVIWDAEVPADVPQHLGEPLARTVVVAGAVRYSKRS